MTTIDTGTKDLLARKENGVGYLVMNRPEARNAMSQEMNKAMQDTIAAFELDNEVRCIVLTGAGKGFCAGGDVKGMASRGDGTVGDNTIDAAIHKQRDHQRGTSGKLFKMPKPTIASLSGAAAGAGLSYALSCDLRIMSSEAFMTTAFAKVGFSGDYGGSYFMTQLIGSAKARELYFLSDRISADEALQFMTDEKRGIVSKEKDRFLGFQALFSWKLNQKSWVDNKLYPVLTVRYEDIQTLSLIHI